MGMNKLDEIISIYQNNRTDDLPVAIIQNGTKDTEKKVVGTISSIAKLVQEHQLSSPAIIVIGEVVRNASKLTTYFQEEFTEDEFIFQNLDIAI
jgi:uroporphyrin-III C-methyltransferase